MLTVITGSPGAGKTANVVERFLMPLAAKDWQEDAITSEGEKVVVKRRVFTNINGLLLEHEKIDADDLMKWQDWVKPGDLIVFDEVQKPWPLTGANKEQPKCITELETHRHYGIDMILMTQHPMLINAAIVRLAGQHLHIRKLGNSRFATIYEWDGVSRTLLYKNAFAKKPWRRSRAAEQAYRSSSLHTKQKRAVPTVLFVIVACLIAFPLMAWKFGGNFTERYFSGKPLIPAGAPASPTATAAAAAAAPAGGQGTSPDGARGAAASAAQPPVFSGCAAIRDRCDCMDTTGRLVEKPVDFCKALTVAPPGVGKALAIIPDGNPYRDRLERQHWAENDANVLAYMGRRSDEQSREASLPASRSLTAKQ
jgi:zona occludens toxin